MINTELLTDILTLRYHPTKSTLIPPLNVNDFTPNADNLTMDKIVNTTDELIKKTIKETIVDDSVSIALSGGVDSSLVLAKIKETLPDLDVHCIGIGFYENDSDYVSAKNLAEAYNCKFHGLIVENPLETLPKQISILQEPRWNGFWSYIAEEASKHSNMLVSGDGGDEIFAGYVFRYKSFLDSLNQTDSWIERAVKYLNCHNRDWVPDQDGIFTSKMNFNWQNIYNKLRNSFDNSLSPMDQVLLADFNGKLLHDWVPGNTKIHNHFNIKGYAPLMNPDLVKWAAQIPYHYKYDRNTNEGKKPLRRLLEKTGHYDLLVDGKKGYAPDLTRLWNNYGKRLCNKYLSNSDIVKYKMVNQKWLDGAFEKSNSGDLRYINKMLSILSFEIWCQLYVSHSIEPNKLI